MGTSSRIVVICSLLAALLLLPTLAVAVELPPLSADTYEGADDHPMGAGVVPANQPSAQDRTVYPENDVDFAQATLRAGHSYAFCASGVPSRGPLSLRIQVTSLDTWESLGSATTFPGQNRTELYYTSPMDQTVFIDVSADWGATGAYRLSIYEDPWSVADAYEWDDAGGTSAWCDAWGNSTLQRDISPPDDVDWIFVAPEPDRDYVLSTGFSPNGPPVDTVMEVYDWTGQQLLAVDDDGVDGGPFSRAALHSDGYGWKVRITSKNGTDVGAYSFALTEGQLTQSPSFVDGRVLDEYSQPFAGVTVSVLDGQDQVVASGVTNSSGDYLIADVPAGTYTLRYESANPYYETMYWYGTYSHGERTFFELTPEQPFHGQIQMHEASISGQVFVAQAGYTYLPGVDVTAYDLGGNVIGRAMTNAQGQWLMKPVPHGLCKLHFSDPNGNFENEWYYHKSSFETALMCSIPSQGGVPTHMADIAKPVTSVAGAPSRWVRDNVEIGLSATDVGRGVANIYYKLGSGAETMYTAPLSVVAEGITTISVWSSDKAGNIETVQRLEIKIDRTAPRTTAQVRPAIGQPTSVTLNASDAGAGVASTSWSLDGGAWTDGGYVESSVPGRHTVQFRSTDAAGNVEAIRTEAFYIGVRTEQDDARIAYCGPWTQALSTARSGGSWSYAKTPGVSATISFTGTGVDVLGSRGPAYGIARATLDGVDAGTVDFYAPEYLHKQVIFSRQGLADAPHTLVLYFTGTKNAASAGTTIDIDAVDATGMVTQGSIPSVRVEENDGRLAYSGTWTRVASSARSGGGWSYAKTAAFANASWVGTGVCIVTSKGPAYGIMRVTLDGTRVYTVDLYSADYQHKRTVFAKSGLTNGTHTLKIEWTGAKNAASAGTVVGLDALDVSGNLLQASK